MMAQTRWASRWAAQVQPSASSSRRDLEIISQRWLRLGQWHGILILSFHGTHEICAVRYSDSKFVAINTEFTRRKRLLPAADALGGVNGDQWRNRRPIKTGIGTIPADGLVLPFLPLPCRKLWCHRQRVSSSNQIRVKERRG